LHDDPKPPRQRDPKVPKDLETVCLKAMAKEPARRYATAGELAADLRRFLNDEPILARPVGRVEKLWRRVRRNPAVAGLSAAVVVLLAGLAAAVVWGRQPPPAPEPAAAGPPADAPADELLQVVAELDRTDPDWRLERIEAIRRVIPDEQNSAIRVRLARRVLDALSLRGPNADRFRDLILRRGMSGRLAELYPDVTESELREMIQSRDAGDKLIASIDNALTDLAPDDPLTPERTAALHAAVEKAGPALVEARPLASLPQGRYTVARSRDMFGTLLPHIGDARGVGRLLEADAVLQARAGRTGDALVACRALLNVGRSIGDEPIAVSQVVRMAGAARGLLCLERILAEGMPGDRDLAPIGDLLRDEVRHPTFEIMVRGERGAVHYFLSALQAGDITTDRINKEWNPAEPLQLPTGLTTRPAHAWILRHLTRLVENARRPPHEQARLLGPWNEAIRNAPELAQKWADWIQKLGFNLGNLAPRCQLVQARLRCAEAAVAVERYRLARGDWPRDLAALVPDYLKEAPSDPYDGRPLRYRRTADGVVVYSVGPDGADDQGKLDRTWQPPDGTDAGFRLWDSAKRRRPPGGGKP
jgi:hypothetical protein